MDRLLPFSDYDVFGCLSTGVAAILVYDLLAGTHYVLAAQWSAADGAILICAAYVIGQIVAAPAAWLIERNLAFKVLGRPTGLLLKARPKKGWRGFFAASILGEYYTPLPKSVQQRLREVAGDDIDPPEALFHAAMAATNSLDLVRGKMETFLRLYGFCRNTAFVALVGALLLALKAMLEVTASNPNWVTSTQFAGAALAVGVGLLHRYFKFLRLYAVTLLSNYAGTKPEQPVSGASP